MKNRKTRKASFYPKTDVFFLYVRLLLVFLRLVVLSRFFAFQWRRGRGQESRKIVWCKRPFFFLKKKLKIE